MVEFLTVVRDHGIDTREVLIDRGFEAPVVFAKALKAGRKGYTDCGVVADRPWLTPAGEQFIVDWAGGHPIPDVEDAS